MFAISDGICELHPAFEFVLRMKTRLALNHWLWLFPESPASQSLEWKASVGWACMYRKPDVFVVQCVGFFAGKFFACQLPDPNQANSSQMHHRGYLAIYAPNSVSLASARLIFALVWRVYFLRFVCRSDWDGIAWLCSNPGVYYAASDSPVERCLWNRSRFDADGVVFELEANQGLRTIDHVSLLTVVLWISRRFGLDSSDDG